MLHLEISTLTFWIASIGDFGFNFLDCFDWSLILLRSASTAWAKSTVSKSLQLHGVKSSKVSNKSNMSKVQKVSKVSDEPKSSGKKCVKSADITASASIYQFLSFCTCLITCNHNFPEIVCLKKPLLAPTTLATSASTSGTDAPTAG